MDVYCKFCREPWELDSIHDHIEDTKYEEMTRLRAKAVTDLGGPGVADHRLVERKYNDLYESELYAPTYRDFKNRGCPALGGNHNASYDPKTSKADPIIEALGDVLGDDADALASELADLRLF